MKIQLPPGRYVVAVSGGVDSVALLRVLRAMSGMRLVVAHYDHGIRPDSDEDRKLVQALAKSYGLPFVYDEGRLGPRTGEARARQARYAFLHAVQAGAFGAGRSAIITAHHQDDVLETAIINIIRGTGRKGLSSLTDTDSIKRPLLHVPKSVIRQYAQAQRLVWREDSTNADMKHLRNHVRRRVLTRFDARQRRELVRILTKAYIINHEADDIVRQYLAAHAKGTTLSRSDFIVLPHRVSLEVMAAWLRMNNIRDFDKKMLERLTRGAKIHTVGSSIPVRRNVMLRIGPSLLALEAVER